MKAIEWFTASYTLAMLLLAAYSKNDIFLGASIFSVGALVVAGCFHYVCDMEAKRFEKESYDEYHEL